MLGPDSVQTAKQKAVPNSYYATAAAATAADGPTQVVAFPSPSFLRAPLSCCPCCVAPPHDVCSRGSIATLQNACADNAAWTALCSDFTMIPRSSFAPVGSLDLESPLKLRRAPQVRRSLTGSFSGPISDDELKQSFMAMRSTALNQSVSSAPPRSPTAARNPNQDNEPAGVGIYFVKNERTGNFCVEHILPGYAAEKCGTILPGDIVTHVGALKLPPELTLEQLRPLIVPPSPLIALHACSCVRLTIVTGWPCWHRRQPHVSARL
jgi:hypothetical protein